MDFSLANSAVQTARKTVDLWVNKKEKFEPSEYPEEFNDKRGVFVTIHKYPGGELRGCIGYPEPALPLIKALVDVAIAASNDPRFEPLRKEELKEIVIEVSVLTKPELIKVKNPDDYLEKIKIGKDGLIVRKGSHSGLLLPQVATEHNLNAEDFLMHTCIKAGLLPTDWLEHETKVYKFQSEIFREEKPYEVAE